jgi:hypothetical protein
MAIIRGEVVARDDTRYLLDLAKTSPSARANISVAVMPSLSRNGTL